MTLENALEPPLPAAVAIVERVARNALQVSIGEGKSTRGAIRVALQANQQALVAAIPLRTRVLPEQNFHFCCIKHYLSHKLLKDWLSPNAERSHAGPLARGKQQGVPPALAGAFVSWRHSLKSLDLLSAFLISHQNNALAGTPEMN